MGLSLPIHTLDFVFSPSLVLSVQYFCCMPPEWHSIQMVLAIGYWPVGVLGAGLGSTLGA